MQTTIATFERVLVIDDSEIDALICSKVFKKYKANTQIKTCLGAKEALNYLKETTTENKNNLPDLILLDLYMPLMNGWFFLMEYKKLLDSFDKKIILLVSSSTAYDSDFNQMQNNKDIDGYISKPITIEKIQHILERYFS